MSTTTSTAGPVQGATSYHINRGSGRKDDETRRQSRTVPVCGTAKRQTIAFFMCVGVAMLAFGSALCWYGVHTDLPDFYTIGPGLLFIGVILVTVAVVFIVRTCWASHLSGRRQREEKEETAAKVEKTKHLEKDYFIPQNHTGKDARAPSALQMYGNDNEARGAEARRATVVNIAETREQDAHRHITVLYEEELGELPPPAVTHPTSITEHAQPEDEQACYTVPLRGKDLNADIPEAASYQERKPDYAGKPPLPPTRGQGTTDAEANHFSSSASSSGNDRTMSGGKTRITSGTRNKVSPSPTELPDRSTTPLSTVSKSGVELELAGMDYV